MYIIVITTYGNIITWSCYKTVLCVCKTHNTSPLTKRQKENAPATGMCVACDEFVKKYPNVSGCWWCCVNMFGFLGLFLRCRLTLPTQVLGETIRRWTYWMPLCIDLPISVWETVLMPARTETIWSICVWSIQLHPAGDLLPKHSAAKRGLIRDITTTAAILTHQVFQSAHLIALLGAVMKQQS